MKNTKIEAVVQRCSAKKVFLEISQVVSLFFNKVSDCWLLLTKR